MHPNQTTLENFYTAFARLDADTMAACYALDAVFDDEVFSLRGHEQVTGMWRMLCGATRAKGADVWKLKFSGVQADASGGKAHWEADYRFSATGRMVYNVIDGVFEFNDQRLITRHRDSFDFLQLVTSSPRHTWLAVELDTFAAQQGQGYSCCKFAEIPCIA
jgi:limonene-1,2-epoxide hydrolase